VADDKPTPVPVPLTKEQLRWIEKQARPWRFILVSVGLVVLIATGFLIAVSLMVDVDQTKTTNVSASASSSATRAAPGPRGSATPSSTSTGTTTNQSTTSSRTTTTEVTTTDGARPSDRLLGFAFALGLLLLLAGAFFTRVTKLSAVGASVDMSPPLPPSTAAVLEKKKDEVVAELGLPPEAEQQFRAGTDALARTLNVSSSIDAETLAKLATEGTAKSLNLM